MNYNQAQQRVQDLKDFTEASYGLQSWLLSFILMIFSKRNLHYFTMERVDYFSDLGNYLNRKSRKAVSFEFRLGKKYAGKRNEKIKRTSKF
jgi:hypothetical protein